SDTVPTEAFCLSNVRSNRFVRTNVRFGSKADTCSAKRHVRFTPKSRHRERHCSAKNPELSPEGFPATYNNDQAAYFRFLGMLAFKSAT
ncbi:MAG: hypothetical protein WCE32_25815, partial [Pseudolabrys sp.]